MGFWFGKKKQAAKFRPAVLPGEMGTISFPADLTVKMEDAKTLLAYPKDKNYISLRVSSFSISRKDGNVETAGKIAVKERAEKEGRRYYEIEDKGILSYEEPSVQNGVPLVVKYWFVGSKNTFAIFSATIVEAKKGDGVVKAILDLIPRILDSLKITKTYRMVVAEERKVESYSTTVDPFPQTIVPFESKEDAWREGSLELARVLGVKYGSGGDLTPVELDVVFSRWMHDEEEKENDDAVANALGAAFGEHLVEQHGFRWVVVTDKYGTEYAVRHSIAETMAFPRTSVQKRIERRCPEFFQDLCLGVLDQLKRSKKERGGP
jgi:hypothetical protein